jgi:hypothetical protein
VQLLHAVGRTRAVFDEPNLTAHAGLVPMMALADRAGLAREHVRPGGACEHVRPGGACEVNAHLKVACLVAVAAGTAATVGAAILQRRQP